MCTQTVLICKFGFVYVANETLSPLPINKLFCPVYPSLVLIRLQKICNME